ncbi:helix-turn-helix transcriptional regulator [Aureibacter tunicatorum]|uniref:AraC-like DNA-binding protein n=1 Tax=Aureibacter tunicatorum TaxID=866807 RepID=A0AAE3XQM1_9BACT|nr:AraC family transcriptional regulator [Aureibacter tunicatorum]MDR6241337.1 AraC-like DNA-binding protein [Aureibacter tunicatorum]BDD03596.1 hypothetical protein AUTU_10790 [Aureibacter tunicatorum]
MKNEVQLDVSDDNTSGFFEKISEKRGGNWNGESLDFSDDDGVYQVISFQYENDVQVGITEMRLNYPLRIVNKPTGKAKHVAIRIGFNGDIYNLKGQDVPTEGVFMYNAAQSYEAVFPAYIWLKWMVIRFPYDYFDKWNQEREFKLSQIMKSQDKWFLYYRLIPEIEALVRECFNKSMTNELRRIIYYARAYEIIGRIMLLVESEGERVVSMKVREDDLNVMFRVKDFILNDFSMTPNLEDLSKQFLMSKSKLQRTFKKVFNMPLLKLYNHHRMEEAHKMLKYSDMPVYEIGEQLGFSDLAHFSSSFKKFFGYNPNDLR